MSWESPWKSGLSGMLASASAFKESIEKQMDDALGVAGGAGGQKIPQGAKKEKDGSGNSSSEEQINATGNEDGIPSSENESSSEEDCADKSGDGDETSPQSGDGLFASWRSVAQRGSWKQQRICAHVG